MNFRIENNYLNINNYPFVAKHLENMARKGWLVSKIILGNIFIYKKIEPMELDFSILPYEIETVFTKKSKEELDEFRDVCKVVGWNYATKSYNLHIYFKEKGLEAIKLQTDEVEEFRTLETIGKRQLRGYYFQMPFMIFLTWMILGGIIGNTFAMKDGTIQISALFLPIGLILVAVNLFQLRRFLKINRKNISLGKSLEYNNGGFSLNRGFFPLVFIILLALIIYIFYSSLFLGNTFLVIAYLPIIMAAIIGNLYRFFLKPSKKSLKYKKLAFIFTIAVAVFIPISLTIFSIGALNNPKGNSNIEGYRVLSINDFIVEDLEDQGRLTQNVSILIPKSVEYFSHYRGQGAVVTEYAKALTESLASNLVNRYKKQEENALVGRYTRELELSFKEGIYDDYLSNGGFTRGDFDKLKNKEKDSFLKAAKAIIRERSIVEDEEHLWNNDETYFLNYERTQIVIRNGKEVFFLAGKDFTDPEIIKIVKKKLTLY